jgi:hypothetical protein
MGKAIVDARIYLGGYELSGYTNAVAINLKTDVIDCTSFGNLYRDKLAGMTDVIMDVSGYFSAADADLPMFSNIGLSTAPLSIIGGTAAQGDRAFFTRPLYSEYTPLDGKVGEMAAFKLHAEGCNDPFVRGRVLAADAARISTGAGTKVNVGAYTATQYLYGVLHVLSATPGPDTLDCTIVIADQISTVTINAAGTGYAGGNKLTVVQTGGSLGVINVDTVDGGGGVTGISVSTPGSGYSVANGLSTTGGAGTGCKVNITGIADSAALITFAQKTAIGSEWKTDAGPITDVNFKAKWTIGGVDPSFTFIICAGVV